MIRARVFPIALVWAATATWCCGQTTRVDLRTQSKSVDFSGAVSTKPSKTGTSLPATCSVGETFFKTDAIPGGNIYACTATNTWTAPTATGSGGLPTMAGQSGKVLSNNGTVADWRALGGDVSGAPEAVLVGKLQGRAVGATAPWDGQALQWNASLNRWEPGIVIGGWGTVDWPVTRTSPTQLSIGAGRPVRFGNFACAATEPATATLSAGTGTVYVYVSPSCELTVAHNVVMSGCVGCTLAAGTSFAPGSFPIAEWGVTSGQFAASGTMKVTLYSAYPLVAGPNIQIAETNGTTTVSALLQHLNLLENSLLVEANNDIVSGTTVRRLAKLTEYGGSSYATTASTADTAGIVGVVTAGAGTSGKAQIAVGGYADCEFENATTVNHYVAAGTAVNGACRDAGASYPTSGQVIGRVFESGTSGPRRMLVFPPETRGANSTARYGLAEANGYLDFSPVDRRVVTWRDDFPHGASLGELSWFHENAGVCTATGNLEFTDYSHPGNLRLQVDSNYCAIDLTGDGATPMLVGLGSHSPWEFRYTFKLTSLLNMHVRVGLYDQGTIEVPGNGLWLRYVAGTDAAFVYENRAGGTSAITESGVAPGTSSWYTLRIRSTAAGTVRMSVAADNGAFSTERTICATGCDISASLPTATLSPFFQIVSTSGFNNMIVDMFAAQMEVAR